MSVSIYSTISDFRNKNLHPFFWGIFNAFVMNLFEGNTTHQRSWLVQIIARRSRNNLIPTAQSFLVRSAFSSRLPRRNPFVHSNMFSTRLEMLFLSRCFSVQIFLKTWPHKNKIDVCNLKIAYIWSIIIWLYL